MSDHDALLQAILDAPDDDAPRLIFADWLDEHDDPERAEFIRIQCRLARLPFFSRRYPALNRRAEELLVANRRRWRLHWLDCQQIFRRGFVEELRISAALYFRLAQGIFEKLPLRWVHFTSHSAMSSVQWPDLTRLEGIEFCSGPFGDPGDWHYLEFPRLRWLKCTGLVPTAIFLRDAACPRLEALDLSSSPSPPDQWEAFVRIGRLRQVRAFALDAAADSLLPHRMRAAGARMLAEAGMVELRQLHLRGQLIGEGGLYHMSRSPSFAKLEELYLDNNDIGVIGPTGIEDLCTSSTLPRLRALSLANNPIGAFEIEELAAWPGLGQLRWLNLSNCNLTSDAVRPLAASPYFHSQLQLNLDGNRFTPEEMFPAESLLPSSSVS